MATIVFGAIGTVVGGPLGGAVGSLLGRAVDREIIGAPAREGPRLKELAVSTSTYGQPIARLFGTSRAAGTILWATDLVESREAASGGKGQPRTTQYSYTISLAVALSSRPIERVDRIWADGNLLRGQAGDLKTGGTLRVHCGHGDQDVDPLLAAALGAQCPAHRGIAYAVFEDLQLGDFGNRLPALSFEVIADGGGADLVSALLDMPRAPIAATGSIAGFAHEGGSLSSALGSIAAVAPLAIEAQAGAIAVRDLDPAGQTTAADLTAAIAWPDGDFGARTGRQMARGARAAPHALRYYDSARDYQPGLQRAAGRAPVANDGAIELPATLDAASATSLIETAAQRAQNAGERAKVRIASLDAAYLPGRTVGFANEGKWHVESWEWRDGGVELDMVRAGALTSAAGSGDAGQPWRPADRLPAPSVLHAFELPWDGTGASEAARVHVAVGAGEGRWPGAALFVERAGTLVPLGMAGPAAAVTGTLSSPLAPSPALMFEPAAAIELTCDNAAAAFATVDGAALAFGANRLLVGSEVMQFMRAEHLGNATWRLSGLLRGRAASEAAAISGHPAGTAIVLLDETLLLFDGATLDPLTERIAAIGAGDPGPQFTPVDEPGRSRRPLTPVHPAITATPAGGLTVEWTRRVRGAWIWSDGIDVPLVEETEAYEVGAGPNDAPLATWQTTAPSLELAPEQLFGLPPSTPFWVRQIGRHSRSAPLLLFTTP